MELYFIRDYNLKQNEDNVLARMLDHIETIIRRHTYKLQFILSTF